MNQFQRQSKRQRDPEFGIRDSGNSRSRHSCRRRIANYWGHTDRKGSVLLVVIGLLLLLMLVGFTFFTFASQEHLSAEYYCDSMKTIDESKIDIDKLMDFGIRQLIVGPNENEKQSVLWPGRHSLVPNQIGMMRYDTATNEPLINDRQPHNGTGINVTLTNTRQLVVDQDYDGLADVALNQELLEINHSQLAIAKGYNRGDFLFPGLGKPPFPSIDVGYTYPDLNNVFLAYIGIEPVTGSTIITPSFHRPMVLRNASGNVITNWYTNAATSTRVIRPHRLHLVAGTAFPRYLTGQVTVGARTINPFPLRVDQGGNSVFGQQGLWDNSGASHDYDTDNDNDGTFEGVFVDLGCPMQTLPDGRDYVVLFSFTVLDADGLVNLNQTGNIAGLANLNHPVGGTFPISRSNLALSPGEINPWWALVADPASTTFLDPANGPAYAAPELQPYRGFFGLSNTNSSEYQISRLEMGNMDLLFLLWGRIKYDVTMSGANEVFTAKDALEGRWGEGTTLQSASLSNPLSFPRPGQPNVDDDADQFEGTIQEVDTVLGTGVVIPPTRYPSDFDGSGLALVNGNNGLQAATAGPPVPQAPLRWRQYTSYQNAGMYPTGPFAAQTMINPNADGLVDATYRDVDEILTDRRFVDPVKYPALYGDDQIFGPEEIAALQMSAADYKAAIGSSRLRQLMPFNLEINKQAAAIRKLFTTESWDRREHGFRFTKSRPWEFNADLNNNWFDNNGNTIADYGENGLEFPPIVSGLTNGAYDADQPFRPELRAAIGMELANTSSLNWPQWRVNINRFLTSKFATSNAMNPYPSAQFQQIHQFGTNSGSPNYYPTNPLQFRQLTPHPANPGAASIPTTIPAVGPPFTSAPTPAIQEFWARRDRQQMARDIYVMLYMFGGGLVSEDMNGDGILQPQEDLNGNNQLDGYVDYSSVSNARTLAPTQANPATGRKLYDEWQLQEMAQFAVNYVDALDRDDVITMFEYDRDLSNGWNLDDNAFTFNDQAAASNDRGVVFGVEAQQLTINEALVIDSMKVPLSPPMANLGKDHPATQFDDSQQDRFYAYVELQNVAPFSVPINSGAWQIAVEDKAVIGNLNDRKLTLTDGTGDIPAGGLYTIGSRTYVPGGTDDIGALNPHPSLLRVDPAWNPTNPMTINLQQIAPAGALSLDLVANSGNGRYILTDAANNNVAKGGFVTGVPDLAAAGIPLYNLHFVLRRRLHPTRTAVTSDADNPWIEVDRFQVQLVLAKTDGTDNAVNAPQILTFRLRDPNDAMIAANPAGLDIQPKLAKLRSVERIQPLTRFDWNVHSASLVANSIGQYNEQSANLLATYPDQVFSQPQFDRDFTSVMDLLSIPLYGPTELLDKLAFNRRLIAERIIPSNNPGIFEARTSQARFLRPDFPNTVATSGATTIYPTIVEPTASNQYVASIYPIPDALTASGYNEITSNISYGRAAPMTIDGLDQWRLDNRWHRILELLEVPSRANMQLEKYMQQATGGQFGLQTRRPGKINLNGIRHREVFQSLLDDPYTFDLTTGGDNFESRDWWYEFLVARDTFDRLTGRVLPGCATSRPYRDLSTVDGPLRTISTRPGVPPLEQTLLRRLMLDGEDLNYNGSFEPGESRDGDGTATPANTNGVRRLFEARTANDVPLPTLPPGPVPSQLVDQQTRHRLMAKVSNNSSNRSNVFVVWMTVGFFDAYRPDAVNQPGAVQIGSEITELPRRRAFFVVDRSLLEDAYNPQTGKFDFKKFIQYRKTIDQ